MQMGRPASSRRQSHSTDHPASTDVTRPGCGTSGGSAPALPSPQPSGTSASSADTRTIVRPFPVLVADHAVTFVQSPPHPDADL